jgi:hypothetical protein
MKCTIVSAVLTMTVLLGPVIAHPGHDHSKEIRERKAYLTNPHHRRSLAHCADQLKARGNDILMASRRSAMVEALRKKRSISTGVISQYIQTVFVLSFTSSPISSRSGC